MREFAYDDHLAGFAYWAKAGVKSGEPFNALQSGFGRLIGNSIYFHLWGLCKLQIRVLLGGMVINSEPADFYKPPWQYMHGKATQELNCIKCYLLFCIVVAVVFGNERDFTVGNIEDALVGNGNSVSVLTRMTDIYPLTLERISGRWYYTMNMRVE